MILRMRSSPLFNQKRKSKLDLHRKIQWKSPLLGVRGVLLLFTEMWGGMKILVFQMVIELRKNEFPYEGPFSNCRGFRKKDLSSYVRDLIGDENFDFLCFQETMMHDFSYSCIRQVDPRRNYLWDWLLAIGRSSGILSRFKLERFDVGVRNQGKFILQHTLWDKMLSKKWSVLNIYGAAHDDQKDDFLVELAAFCLKNKEPYVVGGDFNILRFSSEKNKNYHPSRFSDTFNVVIQVNELREVTISRRIYTWLNNHVNPTLEKLNRIPMSKEWELLFPAI
jgi:exonuclease III